MLNLNFACSLLLFEFPVFSLAQVISHFFLVENTSGEISLNETMNFSRCAYQCPDFYLTLIHFSCMIHFFSHFCITVKPLFVTTSC